MNPREAITTAPSIQALRAEGLKPSVAFTLSALQQRIRCNEILATTFNRTGDMQSVSVFDA